MKNKIKVLGHDVEYECELDLPEPKVAANISSRIMAGYRKGEIEFCRNELIYTLTWRILEPKVLEVNYQDFCYRCPFMSENPSHWDCRHPDYKGGLKGDQSECFEHCPLKKESITIKLKQDEPNNES